MTITNRKNYSSAAPTSLKDNYSEKSDLYIPQKVNLNSDETKLHNFLRSDYFSELKEIQLKRLTHRSKISKIYNQIAETGRPCLDSPWRFIVKVSPKEEKELSILVSKANEKLFYGKNYPLLSTTDSTSKVKMRSRLDSTGCLPINLFNDYRFDQTAAHALTQLIMRL